jgi:hypothetical protein
MKFNNAANRPLFDRSGSTPDVSGAMTEYFQPLVFEKLVKTVQGFQALETQTPINTQGILQPFTARQLFLKAEGQRAWTWFTLHALPTLVLEVDDVVMYKGVQTRVMSRKDYSLYGFVEYELVQDWTGAGP